MLHSPRRDRRTIGLRKRVALIVPIALLALAASTSPGVADDQTAGLPARR